MSNDAKEVHVVFGFDTDESTGNSRGWGPIAAFTDADEADRFAAGWVDWATKGKVRSLPLYTTADQAMQAENARVEQGLQKREPATRNHL